MKPIELRQKSGALTAGMNRLGRANVIDLHSFARLLGDYPGKPHG